MLQSCTLLLLQLPLVLLLPLLYRVIPLRIHTLPPPQILTHLLQPPLCVEPQFLLRQARVGGEIRHVAPTPADNFGLVLEAGGDTHGLSDLEDGHAGALSKVVGFITWGGGRERGEDAGGERGGGGSVGVGVGVGGVGVGVGEGFESEEVTLGKIEDVDVVPNAGSVTTNIFS
jgi:hypothetical protein